MIFWTQVSKFMKKLNIVQRSSYIINKMETITPQMWEKIKDLIMFK